MTSPTLLASLADLGPDATPAERLAYHERKAELLSRIAAVLGTTDAYDVAADAWLQCQRLARQISRTGGRVVNPFSGEQIVQITNPDPFARPVLRSPVLHTPVWMIAVAQLARLLWRLVRFIARHPVASLIAARAVRGLALPGLARARRYRPGPGRHRRCLAPVLAGLVVPAGRLTDAGPVPALALPA